ncbi:MAG: sugar phosphate isomerase/epimerase [Oscillospiraceae bacterium]|nr:sugar phosphate isomerase/epimerase [Oscillospiraceae bacterium]MBR0392483.1 sugar phosphate isomerase/epimerase [Oscillospiraceae bacterium]
MHKLKRKQIAIGNYHYTAWSFDHFLNSVRELEIANIEIWGAKPHFLVGIQSSDYLRETGRKIKDAGLNVVCFCPEQNNYPVNISSAEASLRHWSVEHMKRALEAAAMLGAPTMLLCPGNGTMEENPEAIRDRFVASAEELSRTAADNGVTLALETQAQTDALFMNTAFQQREVLGLVDHPNFKVMLDTVQMAQFDESIEKDICVLGLENIRHVHLGNTVLREKTQNEKHMPGIYSLGRSVSGHIGFREGNLPLIQYLKDLAEAGYEQYVTIEICQKPYWLEADRYAREAWDLIQEALDS